MDIWCPSCSCLSSLLDVPGEAVAASRLGVMKYILKCLVFFSESVLIVDRPCRSFWDIHAGLHNWWLDGGRKRERSRRGMRSFYLPHREWVIQEAKSCHNSEPKHLFLVPQLPKCPSCCPPTVFFFSPPGARRICFLLISLRVADKAVLLCTAIKVSC